MTNPTPSPLDQYDNPLIARYASAEMSRRHNDANVACLGARTQPEERIEQLVDLWLATPFDAGRHAARVAKMDAMDRERLKAT